MPMILVVEDEVPIAELVREVCVDEGYEVLLAANGLDALAVLERSPPDLVLSDVMMPKLDGRALCQAMHAHPVYRTIPIILMSAGRATLVHDVPHSAFLQKPFSLDRLLTTIAHHLP
ncbi:MAG TPA: response regulator [Herpetosiphonaceae bacterium]